jgi:hypothetical protein
MGENISVNTHSQCFEDWLRTKTRAVCVIQSLITQQRSIRARLSYPTPRVTALRAILTESLLTAVLLCFASTAELLPAFGSCLPVGKPQHGHHRYGILGQKGAGT